MLETMLHIAFLINFYVEFVFSILRSEACFMQFQWLCKFYISTGLCLLQLLLAALVLVCTFEGIFVGGLHRDDALHSAEDKAARGTYEAQ